MTLFNKDRLAGFFFLSKFSLSKPFNSSRKAVNTDMIFSFNFAVLKGKNDFKYQTILPEILFVGYPVS